MPLEPFFLNSNPELFDELESTNSYLKNLTLQGEIKSGSGVVARWQSKGRGQMGKHWLSDKGKNILYSFYIKHRTNLSQAPVINFMISIALRDFFSNYTDKAYIKWPNDIYIGSKKIGGILIENTLAGDKIQSSIVGIGLNINQDDFPPTLHSATSLKIVTNQFFDLSILLIELINHFNKAIINLNAISEKILLERYNSYLYRRGDFVTFKGQEGITKKKVLGVNAEGELILAEEQAKRNIKHGELIWIED